MEKNLMEKFDVKNLMENYTSVQIDGNYMFFKKMIFTPLKSKNRYPDLDFKYWCEQASSAAQGCKEITKRSVVSTCNLSRGWMMHQ